MDHNKQNSGIVIDTAGVEIQQRFLQFLEEFKPIEEENDLENIPPEFLNLGIYHRQIYDMIRRDSTTLFVDFNHLLEYNSDLAEQIEDEFYRY